MTTPKAIKQPIEFNNLTPPVSVTNPEAAEKGLGQNAYREYPRHLHRADGSFVEVTDDGERDAKLADGWFLTPGAAKEAAEPAKDDATPPKKGRAA